MEYKPTARSPHYGKIFAYDQNGKELQTVDILKVQLIHNNTPYTVGDLLASVVVLEDQVATLQERHNALMLQTEVLQNKIELIVELLEIQSAAKNADTII